MYVYNSIYIYICIYIYIYIYIYVCIYIYIYINISQVYISLELPIWHRRAVHFNSHISPLANLPLVQYHFSCHIHIYTYIYIYIIIHYALYAL